MFVNREQMVQSLYSESSVTSNYIACIFCIYYNYDCTQAKLHAERRERTVTHCIYEALECQWSYFNSLSLQFTCFFSSLIAKPIVVVPYQMSVCFIVNHTHTRTHILCSYYSLYPLVLFCTTVITCLFLTQSSNITHGS